MSNKLKNQISSQSTNTGSDISSCMSRYERARNIILGHSTQSLVQNDAIYPTWIKNSNCFWYERFYKVEAKVCKEYRIVDADSATNKLACDHNSLAEALSKSTGNIIDKEKLPLSHVSIVLSPLIIYFKYINKRWAFDSEKHSCEEVEATTANYDEVISPDGKFSVFSRGYNLYVRNLTNGMERQLTIDGDVDYAYGVGSTAWGMSLPPEYPALWSSDSKRLLTVQRDKRQVKNLPMVKHIPSNGSIRPTIEQVRVAYPGDKEKETYHLLAVEVDNGTVCRANYRPIPASVNDYFGFFNNLAWWADDCNHAYFIDQTKGDEILRLVKFDTVTGVTRVLFEELSSTYVNILPDLVGFALHRFLPSSNELIWWSERTGWGHLYLYDLDTGELKHPITSGNWRVRDVLQVDEIRRELYIQTSARVVGRDPYYRDICRVSIDSGEMTTLLSDDKESVIHYQKSLPVLTKKMMGQASKYTSGISPNNNFVVTTLSRADLKPITVLLDRNGKELMKVEAANISGLPDGWQWPEPIKLLSADEKTDIYGLLFRPSDFSTKKCYPVINYLTSAPWLSVVPKSSFHNSGNQTYSRHYFYAAALAELGFIVVLLDSRGTPLRDKKFQDESYGWIPSSVNNADHIGGLWQLAERYPYMDMKKVGVFANGYRGGLQHFLECQDIYKVCVAMAIQDSRLIGRTIEGDKYQGVNGPSKDRLYPEELVKKMRGKLFLMHPMSAVLTGAYPPAGAFRVVNALQESNKKFDMLFVPDGGFMYTSYMTRRAWDYLVKHLKGEEPPKEFNLSGVKMS